MKNDQLRAMLRAAAGDERSASRPEAVTEPAGSGRGDRHRTAQARRRHRCALSVWSVRKRAVSRAIAHSARSDDERASREVRDVTAFAGCVWIWRALCPSHGQPDMRADVAIVKNQAGKDRDMSPQMAPEPELTTVVHTPGPGQDCELVEALRDHEPTAADSLVRAYGERAYRLAARITRNEQDAEEVVQDAFYAVIQKIDTFRGESALRLVALPDRGERRLSETPRPWRPRSTNCRPRTGWSWCCVTPRATRMPRSPSSSTSALRP